MEHLIKQIIEIEKRAQEMTAEAKSQKENQQARLNEEISGLREQLMEKARARVEKSRALEEAQLKERISELERWHADRIASMDASFARSRETWVGEIVGRVTGSPG